MNSKDLYPFNKKDIATRLQLSVAALYNAKAWKAIPADKQTYLGTEIRYMADTVEFLQNNGFGRKTARGLPKQAPVFSTPHGTVVLEDNISLPTVEGIERYPFNQMKVGQSFSLPATNKNFLGHQLTAANRTYTPNKYTRRYYADIQQVRVWRIA